jgi:hypothetical protein
MMCRPISVEISLRSSVTRNVTSGANRSFSFASPAEMLSAIAIKIVGRFRARPTLNGRRFRILNMIGDAAKDCLAAVVDTSISARHPKLWPQVYVRPGSRHYSRRSGEKIDAERSESNRSISKMRGIEKVKSCGQVGKTLFEALRMAEPNLPFLFSRFDCDATWIGAEFLNVTTA